MSNELQVNTYFESSQDSPVIASFSDGSFIVAWESYNQDGSGNGIYAQHYNVDGIPNNAEFRINSNTSSHQQNPDLTVLTNDNLVVVWESYYQDGDGYGVYTQLFDHELNPIGGEILVNSYTDSYQRNPSVESLSDGGFVIVWDSSEQAGSGTEVYAQIHESNGDIFKSEFLVNTSTLYDQGYSEITVFDDSFLISWNSESADIDVDNIHVQRYDLLGDPINTEFQINTLTPVYENGASIIALSDGGFVAIWESASVGGGSDGIHAQVFDANDVVIGDEFLVNEYTSGYQKDIDATFLNNGDFVIAWSSRYQDGGGYGVFAKIFNSQSLVIKSEFQVNAYTIGSQQNPSIEVLPEGDFLIAWESNDQDGDSYGVYIQRYDSTGNSLGVVTLNEIIPNTPPTLTDSIMSDHVDMATVDENTYYEHNTSLHFNDADAGDTLTYSATLADGNALPGWISIDSATGILSGTPIDTDVGAIDIMVTATDVAGASVSDGYTLTVNDINNVPTLALDLPVSEVNEDSVFTYDLSSHFNDVDSSDVLTFLFADSYHFSLLSSLNNSSGNWQEEDWLQLDAETGVLTAIPTNDNTEPYKIGINVSDGESSITEYLYLRVNAVNDAPELTGDLTGSVLSGSNITYSGVLTGSDVDDTYISVFDMAANYYHQWATITEETNGLSEYVITIENVWGDSLAITSAEDWVDLDNPSFTLNNIPENYSATMSDGMWESQTTVVNVNNTVVTMESNFGKIIEAKYPNGSYDLLQTGSTRIHWIDDINLTTSYNAQDNTSSNSGSATVQGVIYSGSWTEVYGDSGNMIDIYGDVTIDGVLVESLENFFAAGSFTTSTEHGIDSVLSIEDNLFYQIQNQQGVYGSIALDKQLNWIYTLDNTDPDTVALTSGQTAIDSFIITLSDGIDTTTQQIDITITGSDIIPNNAIVRTVDDMLLDNITLHYIKDGVDTGVSTLVEEGGIKIDQSIAFDSITLSVNNAYQGNLDIMDMYGALDNIGQVVDTYIEHAADTDNNGAINIMDMYAVLDGIGQGSQTFDLVDQNGNLVTSLNTDQADIANWTIVANGDVDMSGAFDQAYVVQADIV